MELHIGDCTFQPKFDKVGFTDTQRITSTFTPPRGEQFVVLLLGTVDSKAQDFDFDAALNALGYFRKEGNHA